MYCTFKINDCHQVNVIKAACLLQTKYWCCDHWCCDHCYRRSNNKRKQLLSW